MAETAPLWGVLLLPVVLAALALVAACFDSVLASGLSGARRASVAPLLDVLRLLGQQRRRTTASDAVLGRIGIGLVPVAAVLAAAVLPWGSSAVTDPVVGVVWFNAMEALAWAAVWLAGWGPNSALSLFGGYRFLAQGLAYELPHMFALTTAALGAESLRVGDIVEAQQGLWFVVWMPAAFLVYLLSALAMSFWGPFGHPLGRDAAGAPSPSTAEGTGSCCWAGGGCCSSRRPPSACRCSSAVATDRCCPPGPGRCSRRASSSPR